MANKRRVFLGWLHAGCADRQCGAMLGVQAVLWGWWWGFIPASY